MYYIFINKNVLYKYILFIMYLYIIYSIQGREGGLEVDLGVWPVLGIPTAPHFHVHATCGFKFFYSGTDDVPLFYLPVGKMPGLVQFCIYPFS